MSNHRDDANMPDDASDDVCPDCGGRHPDGIGILDTATLTKMAEDVSLPAEVRKALALTIVSLQTLVTALDHADATNEQFRMLLGCMIYEAGGSILVRESTLQAAPTEFTVMRHEPYDKPGSVWKINPSEWPAREDDK